MGSHTHHTKSNSRSQNTNASNNAKQPSSNTMQAESEIQRIVASGQTETMSQEAILQLQRQYGNQFVMRLLKPSTKTSHSAPPFPIMRWPNLFSSGKKKDDEVGLLGDEMDSSIDMETFTEDTTSTNPFETSDLQSDETDESDNPFFPKQGKNPGIKTGKTGHTGKFGQVKDTGKVGYSAYSTAKKSKKFAKGVKTGNWDDKIDEKEQSVLAKAFDATGSKLTDQLKEVGSNSAISDTFFGALTNAQALFDKIADIASKGIPIIGAIIKIGYAAKEAWGGWKTYSAWKGAAKEAIEALQPNTDEDTTEKSPLLKDMGGKQSATYAQAKSLRALVSKIFGFAIAVAKGIGEIAGLFTAGLGNLIQLSASLTSAAATGGRWLKALYKMAKDTKGKNREKHANIVMEAADAGDETMLKTLLDLDITGDVWMIKLAAKLGVKYDPKTDGDGWFARKKGKLIKKASKTATKAASGAKQLGKELEPYSGKLAQMGSKEIKKQFIEGASEKTMEVLLNKPKSTDDMHNYLQELKVVDQYGDFSKEVMGKMKSK